MRADAPAFALDAAASAFFVFADGGSFAFYAVLLDSLMRA
jgi:hypothetical protein